MTDAPEDIDAGVGLGPHRSLGRRVFAMAWPNLLYAFSDQGIRLIDMWLVGHVGAHAIGGLGLSHRVMILVAVAAMGVAAGAAPIIGQAAGAGDGARVRHTAAQMLRCMLLVGLGAGVVLRLIARPLLGSMRAAPAPVQAATEYLDVISLGIVFLFLNFAFVSLFRALGQVRTPLVLVLLMNLLNLCLSYPLVVGWGAFDGLGVEGAAWGTIASRALGVGLAWVIWRRRRAALPAPTHRAFFDLAVLRQSLAIGLPISGMGFLRMSEIGRASCRERVCHRV